MWAELYGLGEPSLSIADLCKLTTQSLANLVATRNERAGWLLPNMICLGSCHKLSALPEEIGKLVNLEVLRLRSCTELERLPSSIKNRKKLSFLDIYNCLSIMELPEEIGEMSGLRKINMGQCSRLQQLPVSVLNLGELWEVIRDEEREFMGETFQIQSLKHQHNSGKRTAQPELALEASRADCP